MTFNWHAAAGIPIVIGSGQLPTLRYFRSARAQSVWIGMSGVHANPHFFKYLWRIWSIDDALPDDWRARGIDWRISTPELCFADAIHRMRDLASRNELFLLSSSACKRDDPAAPWDIELVRRNGAFRVAPALADDPDPEMFGHR